MKFKLNHNTNHSHCIKCGNDKYYYQTTSEEDFLIKNDT